MMIFLDESTPSRFQSPPFGTFHLGERPKNCGPGIASYTGHRELRRRCRKTLTDGAKNMGNKKAMNHETHVGC